LHRNEFDSPADTTNTPGVFRLDKVYGTGVKKEKVEVKKNEGRRDLPRGNKSKEGTSEVSDLKRKQEVITIPDTGNMSSPSNKKKKGGMKDEVEGRIKVREV
jgi:hypothetical protein